jgi:hypothetical protein
LVLAQIFCHWKGERKCFAGASEVARNYIFSVVDGIKRILLDREQVLDPTINQQLR